MIILKTDATENVMIFTVNPAGHVFGTITIDRRKRSWEAWQTMGMWFVRVYKGKRIINNREAEQAVRTKISALEKQAVG